jgi:hypothetical protein
MSAAKKKRELNRAIVEHGAAKLSSEFAMSNHTMLNIAESVAAKRISELEQQLAALNAHQIAYEAQAKQQLARREKQVVMMRQWFEAQLKDDNLHPDDKANIQAELASISDLKDFILCDAEPVAWISQEYFTAFSKQGFQVATHKIAPSLVPLYKAKELKI